MLGIWEVKGEATEASCSEREMPAWAIFRAWKTTTGPPVRNWDFKNGGGSKSSSGKVRVSTSYFCLDSSNLGERDWQGAREQPPRPWSFTYPTVVGSIPTHAHVVTGRRRREEEERIAQSLWAETHPRQTLPTKYASLWGETGAAILPGVPGGPCFLQRIAWVGSPSAPSTAPLCPLSWPGGPSHTGSPPRFLPLPAPQSLL